jgi:hypothetical protein
VIRFEANPTLKGNASMDELGLFTLALGLSKPWQVSDLKFSKEDGRLDLWIDFVKGAKFPCPSARRPRKATSTTPWSGLGGISTSSSTRRISMPGCRGTAAATVG